MEEYVYCLECNPPKKFKQITFTHLKSAHDITVVEYLNRHPGANLVCQLVHDKLVAANEAKWADPDYKIKTSKIISDVLSKRWEEGEYTRIKPKKNLVTNIEGHDGYIVDDYCVIHDMIQCQICNRYFKLMSSTHLEKHGITFEEYKNLYPDAKLISDSVRDKHVKSAIGRKLSSEQRLRCGNGSRGRIQPDYVKQRISASLQGISYDEWESFAATKNYCPKFDEVCREANRDKYDRRCFICGKLENENLTSTNKVYKLSVHHVDMNKSQGCNGIRWKLIPLCMKHHRMAHTKIWETRIKYLLNNVWS